MKKALLIVLVAAMAAPAVADEWFGEIYNGDPVNPTNRPDISSTDLINGLAPVVSNRAPQIGTGPELTDGSGAGVVAADFEAHLPMTMTWEDTAGNFTPTQIGLIRSFGGNPDVRNWQNLVVEWKDASGTWARMFSGHNQGHLHAMIHDASGEPVWGANIAAQSPPATESLIEIYNPDGEFLLGGATVHGLRFNYWLVSTWDSLIVPSKEEYDAGFQPVPGRWADVGGSVIQEVDVFIPEPASMSLLALGAVALLRRR